jgi:hypothetical protein
VAEHGASVHGHAKVAEVVVEDLVQRQRAKLPSLGMQFVKPPSTTPATRESARLGSLRPLAARGHGLAPEAVHAPAIPGA